MDRIVRRIGVASARRPWVTVALWAVVVAVVLGLASVAGGDFADDMSAPGSDSQRALELLEESFPEAAGGRALVVLRAPEGDVLADHADVVATALAAVAGVEHVEAVSDPFAGGTVSPDGDIGFASVTLDAPPGELGPEPVSAIEAELEPARAAGLQAEVGGDAAFITAEPETSGAEGVGLLVALLVLLVAFGTVVAAVLPVALAVVAVAVGLGGITLLANAMDVSTAAPTIGAMIGLGVGIDYALFVVARYREERGAGRTDHQALATAMATSGSAVVFAGGTVVVSMAALALTGLGFLASIGFATSLVVFGAVATATTLLPALLTLLGDRIDRLQVFGRRRGGRDAEAGWLWAFAHRVSGRPWPYLLVATTVLLTLALPTLWMQTGFPDAGDDSTELSHRRAHDLLAEGFGPGVNGPFLLVAEVDRTDLDLDQVAATAAAVDGIAFVGTPELAPDGGIAVLPALPTTSASDPATSTTLAALRAALPDGVLVAGLTAMTTDLTTQLDDVLPLFIAAVLLASVLLLLVVFRSVAVPVKAAVMNLLSIGGAYGIVVAVFQWGWGASLLGLERTYAIPSPLPVIFFAVLFGLSMDYEVFLLTRVREEYARTADNAESVARGLASTGRVITSAALIMAAVFLAFVANPSPMVKMMGLGLAVAILLDATVVRMVVVPAAMALLGDRNWWVPAWLDRLLPHVHVDAARAAVVPPAPVVTPEPAPLAGRRS